MTDQQRVFINFMVFLWVGFLIAAMESSLFAQIFGSHGAPILWLSLTVYYSLKRDLTEALCWIYAITLVNISFSYSPVAFFLFTQMSVLLMVKILRERIYWPGGTYFMLVYAISICLQQITYYLLSVMIEDNPMGSPFWLAWFFKLLWVPVLSVPLFFIYEMIDVWTKRPSQESHMEMV